MEQMLRKILEVFPGNTQKQRHCVTGVSLEYLEYSSETPVIERRYFMRSCWKSSKTSWRAIPENKFDREKVLGDWKHDHVTTL